eukprot:138820-Pyramimonas_sp.AAC.1
MHLPRWGGPDFLRSIGIRIPGDSAKGDFGEPEDDRTQPSEILGQEDARLEAREGGPRFGPPPGRPRASVAQTCAGSKTS